MPDRADSIQLLLTSHEIDAKNAQALHALEGWVVVEMLPETDRIGAILLPEVVAGQFRPDVGVVLARGVDVALDVGATVCVRGYDGQWIEGFDAGYSTNNQVRVFGAAARFQGEIMGVEWSESIPLQIVSKKVASRHWPVASTERAGDDHPSAGCREADDIEGGDEFDMYATGPNVIIRRQPIVSTERGLVLPDSATYRTGKATIVSIGPTARLVTDEGPAQLGDLVCYDARGELDFAFGADPDLAIVPDTAIWVVVDER